MLVFSFRGGAATFRWKKETGILPLNKQQRITCLFLSKKQTNNNKNKTKQQAVQSVEYQFDDDNSFSSGDGDSGIWENIWADHEFTMV